MPLSSIKSSVAGVKEYRGKDGDMPEVGCLSMWLTLEIQIPQ